MTVELAKKQCKTPGKPEENVSAAAAPNQPYPAAGIWPFRLSSTPYSSEGITMMSKKELRSQVQQHSLSVSLIIDMRSQTAL